jgi:hypothetical protein
LEGLEVGDFLSGMNASIFDNVTLGGVNQRVKRQENALDKDAFRFGENMGDALSASLGMLAIAAGGLEVGITTVGVVSAPAATIGIGAISYGTALATKATASLASRAFNSEGGRGNNNLKPDPKAEGEHSTFRTNTKTGKTTNTATYEKNPKNPSGYQETKRVDVEGASHKSSKTGKDIPTPHVHEAKIKDPRPAKKEELPRQ